MLAHLARLGQPFGVASTDSGNVAVADYDMHCIWLVPAASGLITHIAGSAGSSGFAGDGGPATAALLRGPSYVAWSLSGDVVISDTLNHALRLVSVATGTISTVAGTGVRGSGGDNGPASAAQLAFPQGVAVDPVQGTIYFADSENHRVRAVWASGLISTVAGGGVRGDAWPATSAALVSPQGVAIDTFGRLFVSEPTRHVVRAVIDSYISTFAGTSGAEGWSGDNGPASSARLRSPAGLAVDAMGSVFIADTGNSLVRRVGGTAVISTVAGNGLTGFSNDGAQALQASLNLPSAVAVDGSGNLIIADALNRRVRRVWRAAAPASASPTASLSPTLSGTLPPTPSVTPSTTPSRSATTSRTPSLSPSLTAPGTRTRSQGTSPSRTATGTATRSPAATRSATSVPSVSSSRSRTSSGSRTPTPSSSGSPYVIDSSLENRQGGPVLHGRIHLFLILYGSWTPRQVAVLEDAARGMGNTPWMSIVTTYYDSLGPASSDVVFGGSVIDTYSQGAALGEGGVLEVVTDALDAGRLPVSPNAMYAVITSRDVVESPSFCTYCGYHDVALYAPLNSTNLVSIKYAFAGDASLRCPSTCVGGDLNQAPNADVGVDGVVSVLAHEVAEIITDPLLNAWLDINGEENADLCEFQFGDLFVGRYGGEANVRWGSRDFLVQMNFVHLGKGLGYCALAMPPQSTTPTKTPSSTLLSASATPSATSSIGAPPSASIEPTRSSSSSASPPPSPSSCPASIAEILIDTASAGGRGWLTTGTLVLHPSDSALPSPDRRALGCSDGGGAFNLGASALVRVTINGAHDQLSVTAVNITDTDLGEVQTLRLWAVASCSGSAGQLSCLAGNMQPVFLGASEYGWRLRLPPSSYSVGSSRTFDILVERPIDASGVTVQFELVVAFLGPVPVATPSTPSSATTGCPGALAFNASATSVGGASVASASISPPAGRVSSLVDVLTCIDGGLLSDYGIQLQLAVILPASVTLGGTLVVNVTTRARLEPPVLSVYMGHGCFAPRGAAAFDPLAAATGTFVCSTGNNVAGVGLTTGVSTAYTRTAIMPMVASRVVTLLLHGAHLAAVALGETTLGFAAVYIPPTTTPSPSPSRGTSPSAAPSPSRSPLACPVHATLAIRSDDGTPAAAPVVQLNASAAQLESVGLCADGSLLSPGPAALVVVTVDAPLGGTLRVSTCNDGTDFDTVVYLGTGCPAASPGASLACLASNDDDASCGSASTLELPSLPQATVYVMVKPFAATTVGRFVLRASYIASGAVLTTPSVAAAASATSAPLEIIASPMASPASVTLVGAYIVGDNDDLEALGPVPVSCREACAAILSPGGSAGRYQCSVDPPSVYQLQLGTAWVWGGNGSLCGPRGASRTPGRDDFKAGVQVGDAGSWSAYARGGCPGSINYCYSTTGNSGPAISRSVLPSRSRTPLFSFPSRSPPAPAPTPCPLGPVIVAIGARRLSNGNGYGKNPRTGLCKVRFVNWADTSRAPAYCNRVLREGDGANRLSWVDAYGHPACDVSFPLSSLLVDKRGRNDGQDIDASPPEPCLLPPGTAVTRGMDWPYGDEDGGAGSLGLVTDVLCPDERLVGLHSCAVVWPATSPCSWGISSIACNCSYAALLGAHGHFHYASSDLSPVASTTPSGTLTMLPSGTASPSGEPTPSSSESEAVSPSASGTRTRTRTRTSTRTRTRSATRSATRTRSPSLSRKPKPK